MQKWLFSELKTFLIQKVSNRQKSISIASRVDALENVH